ncbi:hypothetical protein Rhopal_005940-T1 [Rhodotorula paludigena]|uniref:RCC1-like domain-containing protein n=1 Tax=Rhodotorula paludigena TaxID=86838 RepID=A0AAV5GJW1_9BASI|nr:hypothetical protein Rhopal_005940-T1 [Rhodotorula paludigena]
MPPRRARSGSVASTTSAATGPLRRSSRPSIVPPPVTAPKNPGTPSRKQATTANGRRRRASSVVSDLSEDEDDSDEDGEETATSTGSKKRKASSSSARSGAKASRGSGGKRVVKPKPVRAPIKGINALPARFAAFPPFAAFADSFAVPELPAPEDAPRTVFVFGAGDMGQHGLGTDSTVLDEIKRPRRHVGFEEWIEGGENGWEGGVADLVCGGMHTLAINNEGKVYSWGVNDHAALGRVTNKPDVESEELESRPMEVEQLGSDLQPFRAVRVAAGDSVSLAISENGEVRAWGSFRSAEGLLGFDGSANSSKTQLVPQALRNLDKHTIVQIACGDDHFLALTSTGLVFACGNGEQHQLGRKIIQRHKEHGLTPERLALKNIVLVGAGSYGSFAVDTKGEVYAWGLNTFNHTGVSDEDGGWEEVIVTPTIVRALSPSAHGGARVVQIAGGTHHTLFLFSNGEVWAVGRTDGHEVGLADSHAEMADLAQRKKAVEAERAERRQKFLAEALSADGQTVVRTDDEGNVLPRDEVLAQADKEAERGTEMPNECIAHPVKVDFPLEPKEWEKDAGPADVDEESTEVPQMVQIAVGTRHSFAVSARGYAYSWGVNASSQLGVGPNKDEVDKPTRIMNTALSNVRVVRVETGGQHSVIVGVDREYEDKAKARKQKRDERDADEQKKRDEADAAKGKGKAAEEDQPKENGDAKAAEDTEMANDKKDEAVVENGAAENGDEKADEPKEKLEPVVEV